MTADTIPASRRYGTQARYAAKAHRCAACSGIINKGDLHLVRPERVGRHLHSRHEHLVCDIPPKPEDPQQSSYHMAFEKPTTYTAYVSPKRSAGIDGLALAFILAFAMLIAGAYIVASLDSPHTAVSGLRGEQ